MAHKNKSTIGGIVLERFVKTAHSLLTTSFLSAEKRQQQEFQSYLTALVQFKNAFSLFEYKAGASSGGWHTTGEGYDLRIANTRKHFLVIGTTDECIDDGSVREVKRDVIFFDRRTGLPNIIKSDQKRSNNSQDNQGQELHKKLKVRIVKGEGNKTKALNRITLLLERAEVKEEEKRSAARAEEALREANIWEDDLEEPLS